MIPNAPNNMWIGWVCENGHHRPLGKWQLENMDKIKSESLCGVCGTMMIPCSGEIVNGKLEDPYRSLDQPKEKEVE